MYRKSLLAAVCGLALAFTAGTALAAAPAKVSPLQQKATDYKELKAALAKGERVRVVIRVKGGLSSQSLQRQMHAPATRAAAKAAVQASIDPVIASLPARPGATDVVLPLTTVPAFSVALNAKELAQVVNDPRVEAVTVDRIYRKGLDATLPLIGMPAVYAAGGTGAGRTVAVIDDGIERAHQFIGAGRVIAEACFLATNSCPNGRSRMVGPGSAEAVGTATHGTHVSGIAMGNRASGVPLNGVAKGARLIMINIFGTSGFTSFSQIQRAYEHVEDLVLTNNAVLKIDAVNMSVGGGLTAGHCDNDPTMVILKPVIDSLKQNGVLSTVSAGNNGTRTAMSFPACVSSIISVASTSRTGVISSFTDISPTTDLLAPGGEFGACVNSSVRGNTFGAFCGTSMAAPHVAGAVAALRQRVPGASASTIESWLKATGVVTPDTRAGGVQLTKRRILVSSALARILAPVAAPNNLFANAVAVSFSRTTTVSGYNMGATLEAGEPQHVLPGSAKSVWWKWTAPRSGRTEINTQGSNFNTVLAVYTGAAVNALGAPVAINDDAAANDQTSRVTFNAVAGVTYKIAVGSKTAAHEGSVELTFAQSPPNDNFAVAQAVTVSNIFETGLGGYNHFATVETGEPNSSHGSSVWYRFIAPATGPFTIDTCGNTGLDTVLGVYTGVTVNALTTIASNDDACGFQSRVIFNGVAGTTYRVRVAGFGGQQGRFRLFFTPPGANSTVARRQLEASLVRE
jgi:hypothetical protein